MMDGKDIDTTIAQPMESLKAEIEKCRCLPALDPFLVILSGVEKGKKILLMARVTLVGRAVKCNVQIKDPMVSSVHGEIILENNCYLLKDLDSSNGTLLNGRRIKSSPLKNGDKITLGSTDLIFTVPEVKDDIPRK